MKNDKIIIGISDVNKDAQRMKYRNWVGWLLVQRGMGHIRPAWEHHEGEVFASVSKGRWYVKCTGESCGVCMAIDENEPFFFCVDCLNIDNDFKPQKVIWGSFGHINRLKNLLALRPDYRTRNYLPHDGETIRDLQRENKRYEWSK